MSERAGIAAVVLLALAIRVAFAVSLPPWQAPDEQAHRNYVVHLHERGSLPVQPPRTLEMFADPLHQAYQPPLAYLLFLPAEFVLDAAHASPKTRLRAARIQNACYGAATVLVVALVAARLAGAGDRRRWWAALVVGFLPGFVAAGSAVNNDSLANLLAATLWWTLIPGAGREASAWRAGAVLGAACLAKLTCLTLAPALVLVPWLCDRRSGGEVLRFAGVGFATAFAILLPWMIRNVAVYGDPLAIGVGSLSFEWLATQLPAAELEQIATPQPGNILFQFFGRFGAANNLSWIGIPLVFGALSLAAAGGWVRALARRPFDDFERTACVAAIVFAIALAGLVAFSLQTAGAWQGRYLYGSMLPVALLLAAGWERLLSNARGWVAVAVLVALLVGVDVLSLAKVREFFATRPAAVWVNRTPM